MRALKRKSNGTGLSVAVIGGGISGILVGIKLIERGITDFTIYEKAGGIGGTWYANTYPGVACDVPSHLYVYSFAPNPGWTHTFAAGADILRYYEGVARRYGVIPHVRLNTEIASAEWRGVGWRLKTTTGEAHTADVVISAVGRLQHPNLPDIAGLETFEGASFHSARWRQEVATGDRRVGVVGTGSSATQITASLSRTASKLSLFQRTPQWVLSIPNLRAPWWLPLWLRLAPGAGRRHYRRLDAALAERTSILNKGDRTAYDKAARTSLDQIIDPVVKARLTPDYAPGCKRMVRSPDFHEAVQRPNVEVVVERIDHVEPRGVVTTDGRLHELDVLVLATGFQVDAFMRPMTMTGDDGVTLAELWKDGPINYRSVTLPHMPNFFMINGPYSPGGSASIVSIAEIGVGYVMQCLDRIGRERVAVMPRMDRSREILDAIRERASKTVWITGGCKSWYIGPDGVPIVNPATLAELAEDLRAPEWADYDVAPLPAAQPEMA